MPCEDEDVCLGVATKPICVVGWKGSSACIRILPEKGTVEFLESKSQHTVDPRKVAENEEIRGSSMAELANRAAEAETTLTSGPDHSTDNTPEAEHNR